MKETRIKKIVLEIDGKDISLGLDEAKQLQDALNEMFQRQQTVVHCHCHHCRPWQVFWSSGNWNTTGTGINQPIVPYRITTTAGNWPLGTITSGSTS